VPTVIRFGEQQRARVRARDDSWREIAVLDLDEYVSEEHNPENAKGVVGAEPPLAGEELALVEAVARHVEDLILVINKADRTTDEERAAAVGFTRKVLEKRLQRPAGPVFEVSAVERLENRGPERDWEGLLEALRQLVEESGRQLIRAACERGLERL